MKKKLKRVLAFFLAVAVISSSGMLSSENWLHATAESGAYESDVTAEKEEEIFVEPEEPAEELSEEVTEEPVLEEAASVEETEEASLEEPAEEETDEAEAEKTVEPEQEEIKEDADTGKESEEASKKDDPEVSEAEIKAENPVTEETEKKEEQEEPEAAEIEEDPLEKEEEDQKKPAEDQEEDEMPVFDFEESAENGVKVTVHAPEGAFPKGTVMKVSALSDEKALQIFSETVAEGQRAVDARGVDITFYNADGEEIQPEKKIDVSLTDLNLEGDQFRIVHEKENGKVEVVTEDATSDGAEFQAVNFSPYVGGSEEEIPAEEQVTPADVTEEEDDPEAEEQEEQKQEKLLYFGVNASKTYAIAGEEVKVSGLFMPESYPNKTIQWESSGTDIATVDENGLVSISEEIKTPVSVTITGTAADGSEASIVIDIDPVKVTGITISGYVLDYMLSEREVTLTAEVTPENAVDRGIVWSSSDQSIVKVDQNGKVTAVNEGEAEVLATNNASGLSVAQKIIVYKEEPAELKCQVWVKNTYEGEEKEYFINIPKDGSEVPVEDFGTASGYVYKGFAYYNASGRTSMNIGTLESLPRINAVKYDSGKLQYKSLEDDQWKDIKDDDTIAVMYDKLYGSEPNVPLNIEGIRVIVGDPPVKDPSSHNGIQILIKDESGNSLYNSGEMYYDKTHTGFLGEVGFDCKDSRYEIESVVITKNGIEVSLNGPDVKFLNERYLVNYAGHGEYVITAIIKLKEFSVTYDWNGGKNGPSTSADKVKVGDTVTVSSDKPEKENYIFNGWLYEGRLYQADDTFTMPISDVTLKANWISEADGVTYQSNKKEWGSVSRTYELKTSEKTSFAGSTANPEQGYEFVEWKDSEDEKITSDKSLTNSEGFTIQSGETYTAYFKPTKYTIAYKGIEGVTTSYDGKTTYTIEDDVYTLPEPKKQGYNFIGWTGEGLATPTKNVTIPKGSTGNKTYTAHFEKERTGVIVYDLGSDNASWEDGTPPEGIVLNGSQEYVSEKKFAEGDSFTVLANLPVREGYTFVGWVYYKKDGVSVYTTPGKSVEYIDSNGEHKLTAIWGSIVAKNNTHTYDGQSHKVNAKLDLSVMMGTSTEPLTYDGESTVPEFKDAGEHSVRCEAVVKIGTEKISVSSIVKVEITKRTITVTADDQSKEFGESDPEFTYQSTGQVGTEIPAFEGKLTRQEGESVGTYEILVGDLNLVNNDSFKASNYEIQYKEGTLEIVENGGMQLVVNGYNERYDGKSHGLSTIKAQAGSSSQQVTLQYSLTDPESGDPQWSNDPVTFTNVTNGPQTVWVKASAYGYEDKIQSATIEIRKRNVTVTSATQIRAYNGKALTNHNIKVSGDRWVSEKEPEYVFSGTQTYVGSSENEFEILNEDALKTNYNITKEYGLLTVTDGTATNPLDTDKVITKTHNGDGAVYGLNDPVTFEIKATNIYGEPKDITISELPGVTLAQSRFENVKPGDTVTTTATYTITEADLLKGSFENRVKVSFEDEKDFENTDTVGKEELEEPESGLVIHKARAGEPENGIAYVLGETIRYEITAENTGNVTLTDVVVTDELTGDQWTIETLLPGETSGILEALYEVQEADILAGTVVNTATASGTDPEGNPVDTEKVEPGTEEVPVETEQPSIFLEKTAAPGTNGTVYGIGEEITYTIRVVNNGNVTVSDITVTDELTGESWTIDRLAPGTAETMTTVYTVTEADIRAGQIVNVATVSGINPDGGGVDNDDRVTVTTDPADPSLYVEKNVVNPKDSYQVGDTISYEIVVSNRGNVDLHHVRVRDILSGTDGSVTFTNLAGGRLENGEVVFEELGVGQTVTLNCEYEVRREDANASISNRAEVTSDEGSGPSGDGTTAVPAEQTYSLTIHYQSANGETLAADYVGSYLAGETFRIETPAVPGYTPVFAAINSNADGMPAENLEFTVIYNRNRRGTGGGGSTDTADDPAGGTGTDAPGGAPADGGVVPAAAGNGITAVGTDTAGGTADTVTAEDAQIPLDETPGEAVISPSEEGGYELTPVADEDVPLAGLGDLMGGHDCCVLHFLVMLMAMVVLGFYTNSRRRYQLRIYELREKLDQENRR